MRIDRWAGLTVLLLGWASPVLAQEPAQSARAGKAAAVAQAMDDAMTPGAGQKRLEPMVGSFDVKILTWVDPSKKPVESKAVSINTWMLDGRYIQSMLSGYVLDEPFSGIGYTAYDNPSKTYQTAWMDTGSTGMVWYRGGFDASGKSATMKGSVTNAVTGAPSPVELRLSIGADGGHTTQLWGPGPGNKMVKLMELHYTRK